MSAPTFRPAASTEDGRPVYRVLVEGVEIGTVTREGAGLGRHRAARAWTARDAAGRFVGTFGTRPGGAAALTRRP